MNIHKRTRLTPLDRQEIWQLYQTRLWKVTHLAERYRVSRPTIYQVIKRARRQEFAPRDSTNTRFQSMQYGLKRLAKVEQSIQDRLKREARRYNKSYPGEMLHVDTKRLPLLKGETNTHPRSYLFVGIDDFSRELYAAILPDKTQNSAAHFLTDIVRLRGMATSRHNCSSRASIPDTPFAVFTPPCGLVRWSALLRPISALL